LGLLPWMCRAGERRLIAYCSMLEIGNQPAGSAARACNKGLQQGPATRACNKGLQQGLATRACNRGLHQRRRTVSMRYERLLLTGWRGCCRR
jgi:hypothetical protein